MTVPGGHENSVRAIARFLAAPIHRPHMARVTSRRTWQWLVWCFRAAIVVLLVLVAGSPPVVTYRLDALSHDYYVAPRGSDSGPGARSAPWRTIQHAASVVMAGSTVHVARGLYPEGTIATAHSGTPTAPLTLVADSP